MTSGRLRWHLRLVVRRCVVLRAGEKLLAGALLLQYLQVSNPQTLHFEVPNSKGLDGPTADGETADRDCSKRAGSESETSDRERRDRGCDLSGIWLRITPAPSSVP